MLNKLLFASLLALSSSATLVADADTRPMPPASKTCLVTTEATTPVFQIDFKSDVIKDYVARSLVVVSNGAWTYTETKNGKPLRTEAGCLAKADLDAIKSSLGRATWKTTLAEMRCMAYAADFTEYRHNGKLVLTSRMCDGVILDDATQKGLAAATAITNKLVPAKK
jgi:hypothetical protein